MMQLLPFAGERSLTVLVRTNMPLLVRSIRKAVTNLFLKRRGRQNNGSILVVLVVRVCEHVGRTKKYRTALAWITNLVTKHPLSLFPNGLRRLASCKAIGAVRRIDFTQYSFHLLIYIFVLRT